MKHLQYIFYFSDIFLVKVQIQLTYDRAPEVHLFLHNMADCLQSFPPGKSHRGTVGKDTLGHFCKHLTQVLLSGRVIV